jgi:predicted DNA-binding transcriptional regulator YafY
MPNTLQPLIRYRTIDHCLRRVGKRWSWEELAEACGEALRYYIRSDMPNPSRRTIMYDIDHMRHGKLGYYAPIVYDRGEKTYHYEDPEFSISNSPLNQEDMQELNQALTILKQFSGFRQVEGIENIITKLEHTMNLQAGNPRQVIQFDHPVNAPGQKWLDRLYESIYNQKPLQLSYQPFHYEEPMLVEVSPHLLKEYNNRWFLIAWNHAFGAISTYALDRIQDLAAGKTTFQAAPDFDPNRYFKDIIGVSIPEEGVRCTVRLAASAKQARYIQTKPLHPSQVLEAETATEVIFRFQLIPNYELESLILSFGKDLRVLEPRSLLDSVAERRGV